MRFITHSRLLTSSRDRSFLTGTNRIDSWSTISSPSRRFATRLPTQRQVGSRCHTSTTALWRHIAGCDPRDWCDRREGRIPQGFYRSAPFGTPASEMTRSAVHTTDSLKLPRNVPPQHVSAGDSDQTVARQVEVPVVKVPRHRLPTVMG